MTMTAPGELTVDMYQFLSFEEAAAPKAPGLYWHYTDMYWLVHPVRGLAFFNPAGPDGERRFRGLGAAQCNADPQVAEMTTRLPWPAEARLIASAWVPRPLTASR